LVRSSCRTRRRALTTGMHTAERSVRRSSSGLELLLQALAFLPPALIFLLVAKLGVNVPFQDDWDTATVLVKSMDGSLTLADFWAQQSEHRILTVRLFIWLVGTLTRFNLVAQMFFGAAVVVIALLLYRSLARRYLSSRVQMLAATASASLLLFTLVLQERW